MTSYVFQFHVNNKPLSTTYFLCILIPSKKTITFHQWIPLHSYSFQANNPYDDKFLYILIHNHIPSTIEFYCIPIPCKQTVHIINSYIFQSQINKSAHLIMNFHVSDFLQINGPILDA